jgi:hypothetical protein
VSSKYQIAAYYFPNYHVDPQNEVWHGKGWTEWDLVKNARPRFSRHRQPRVPLWGYEDESDPAVMGKKIDVAVAHGLDAFIFDWYWHEEGPYLSAALERGFLHAPNPSKGLAFALMWANHDWADIHPAPRTKPWNVLRKGATTPAVFRDATAHVIDRYFSQDNYWRLDGRPYFSFYDVAKLVDGLGGPEAAAEALADFRMRSRHAGCGDLHLNAILWTEILLPGEGARGIDRGLVERLGFDSVTHYVWLHHATMDRFPLTPYARYRESAVCQWEDFSRSFSVPYFPVVCTGWDSSPRTIASDRYEPLGYPFLPVLEEATPAEFREALESARAFLELKGVQVATINAWNEWTEGAYLEPDTWHGLAYLEAVRDVFGRTEASGTKVTE